MKNLFFILIAFLLIGCRDSSEDDAAKLPPETQTGANTFGCLVNGRLFYPRDGTSSVGGNAKAIMWWGSASSTYQYDELDVNNFKDGKPINNFMMHLQDISTIGKGEYIWKDSNFKSGVGGLMQNYLYVRAFDYNTNTWKWYSSYENSGKTTITSYTESTRIVSGTFSGKLRTEDGKETIEITNGRFDINWATVKNSNFP